MLINLISKNLLQRPLRYVLTGLSIAFGVAAVTAVFIFTDGLRTTFDELSGNIECCFDVAVRTDQPFGDGLEAAVVPLEILALVEGVDGVASVQPRIIEFGVVVIDGEGEALISNGPNIGSNWEGRTPNPRQFIQEGRPPDAAGEFAMDIDSFDSGVLELGQTYKILTPSGSQEFELVGTFSFGDPEVNASVGAFLVAFEESEALQLLNGGRGYDDLTIIASGSSDQLVERLTPLLEAQDETLVAATQQTLIEETQGDFGQILGIFQTVLLVFAFIILLVSAFLIFNVFTITLGQRIKELGLLRAIGAFGSQVTSMMLGEALFLGILATIVGLPSGWLLARLLRFGLSQLGFPGDTGLPIKPFTILAAIMVGVVVTLLASIIPSMRARRVTPMAALRDGDALKDLDTVGSPVRGGSLLLAGAISLLALRLFSGWSSTLIIPIVAGILLFMGLRYLFPAVAWIPNVALLVAGLVTLTVVRFMDLPLGETFGLLGAGAALTILGASLVSGLFAGPASRVIGLPIPSAVIVGLLGVIFGLAAIGSVIGAVVLVIQGYPAAAALPLAGIIAALASWALLRTAWGAFGLTGQLARENAARNPQRTATTATALMIGLALVTTVTVIGESIKASVTNALESSITSDWLIQGPQSGPQGLPFSTDAKAVLDGIDEIELTVGYRFSFAGFASLQGADPAEVQAAVPRLFAAIGNDDAAEELDAIKDELGAEQLNIDTVSSVDFTTIRNHVDPDFVSIVDPPADGNGIWVEDGVASDRGLEMGDTYPVVFLDGSVETLTVSGIYEDGFVFGDRVIDVGLWERHLPKDTYAFITATNKPGVDFEVARAAVEKALEADYPILTVQDREEFAADAEAQIDQTLAVVNVLLLLSAAIAILGIAIALSLAVFERTREIGLLRAVGTTREQTRWIIRWEGVIVAAFGGIVGVVIGIGLGVLATQKMPEFLVNTTQIPYPQLIAYIIVAAVTGLGAGAFPAWIAGRMNVLDAISHE